MRNGLKKVGGMLHALSTAALWIAGIGLCAMTVIVAYQVFMRYVVNASPAWTESGSIMIMSWFIFLGAAVGVRENFHMGFDVLIYVLPRAAKSWLRTISDLAVFAFSFGMVYFGGELALRGLDVRIPVIGLPQTFTYLPIVIAGFLMCLFSLERILLRFAGENVDEPTEDVVVTAD